MNSCAVKPDVLSRIDGERSSLRSELQARRGAIEFCAVLVLLMVLLPPGRIEYSIAIIMLSTVFADWLSIRRLLRVMESIAGVFSIDSLDRVSHISRFRVKSRPMRSLYHNPPARRRTQK